MVTKHKEEEAIINSSLKKKVLLIHEVSYFALFGAFFVFK